MRSLIKTTRLRLIAVSALCLFLLSAAEIYADSRSGRRALKPDPQNPEYVEDEVLIKFKSRDENRRILKSFEEKQAKKARAKRISGQPPQSEEPVETGISSLDSLNARHTVIEMERLFPEAQPPPRAKVITLRGERREVPDLSTIYKLKLKGEVDVQSAVEEYNKNANVEYAEPNYIAYACEIPNDPDFPKQWGLHNTGQYHLEDADIDAPEAWDEERGDSTMVIGILDTGVDLDHSDLDDKMTPGYDFVWNDNDPTDDNGHGTHVAGIAAAETNNGIGIAGMCWYAKIMPVKVLNQNGKGSYSQIAQGVEYARAHGADVINMSLGGYADSQTLKDALANAYSSAVLVAATGNDERAYPMYPARYPYVIGVEATDVKYVQTSPGVWEWIEVTAGFSNTGGEVAAPGVSIYSTFANYSYDDYAYLNGTSMASAFVAGLAGLLRSSHPDWSNERIFVYVIKTAETAKRINAYAALTSPPIPPDIQYVSHVIVDTTAGGDNDGIADAGETVEMVYTVKNYGGDAYNVTATLKNEYLGAPNPYITLIDSVATFTNISAYATDDNDDNPIRFSVSPDAPNNYYFKFTLEITADGGYSTSAEIEITIQRGTEISGYITENEVWSPNYLYLLVGNTNIAEGCTLSILPGTEIRFSEDVQLGIDGCLIARGTEDSLITLTADAAVPSIGYYRGLNFSTTSIGTDFAFDSASLDYEYQGGSILEYCELEYGGGVVNYRNIAPLLVSHCQFRELSCAALGNIIVYKSRFEGNIPQIFRLGESKGVLVKNEFLSSQGDGGWYTAFEALDRLVFNVFDLKNYWYVVSGVNYASQNVFYVSTERRLFENPTVVVGNSFVSFKGEYIIFTTGSSNINATDNWWGGLEPLEIEELIWDHLDDPSRGTVQYEPFLTSPPSNVPGHVVEIALLPPPPVGSEEATFTVTFNRPMDISTDPWVTFGVREPYTQHSVSDNAAWVDSTHWQATYTFDATTGDGINTIRVVDAKDPDGLQIPEDTRFQFDIDTSTGASIAFAAIPGNGKVYINWEEQELENRLGYNLYRYTASDTNKVRINPTLLLGTGYTDTTVVNDTTYSYAYTVMNTSFTESDYSNPVSAKPGPSDLQIGASDFTLSKPVPKAGDEIALTANIHNVGTTAADTVVVQFYEGHPDSGGTQIGAVQTSGLLQSGFSVSEQVTWNTAGLAGPHRLYVVVDPDSLLGETQYGNNTVGKDVIVDPNVMEVMPVNGFFSQVRGRDAPDTDGGDDDHVTIWYFKVDPSIADGTGAADFYIRLFDGDNDAGSGTGLDDIGAGTSVFEYRLYGGSGASTNEEAAPGDDPASYSGTLMDIDGSLNDNTLRTDDPDDVDGSDPEDLRDQGWSVIGIDMEAHPGDLVGGVYIYKFVVEALDSGGEDTDWNRYQIQLSRDRWGANTLKLGIYTYELTYAGRPRDAALNTKLSFWVPTLSTHQMDIQTLGMDEDTYDPSIALTDASGTPIGDANTYECAGQYVGGQWMWTSIHHEEAAGSDGVTGVYYATGGQELGFWRLDIDPGHPQNPFSLRIKDGEGNPMPILNTSLFSLGDFTYDDVVDTTDLAQLRGHWHEIPSDPGWDAKFDLKGDAIVDIGDVLLWYAEAYTGGSHGGDWIPGDYTGAPDGYLDSAPDDYVDIYDLMALGDHWHTRSGQGDWDTLFDISAPEGVGVKDGSVDIYDLLVFADNWHTGDGPVGTGGGAPRLLASADPAQSSPQLTLDFDPADKKPGDQIAANVLLKGLMGLRSFRFVLSYDPRYVKPIKQDGQWAVEGEVLRNNDHQASTFFITDKEILGDGEERVDVSASILGEGESHQSEGILATFVFEMLKEGGRPPKLSDVLLRDAGNNLLTAVPCETRSIPKAFALFQNYPNPFNLETIIRFQLPTAGQVSLNIYDVLGRLVKTWVDERKEAGYYTIQWDGMDSEDRQVASGVYLYRIKTGSHVSTRKMILLK